MSGRSDGRKPITAKQVSQAVNRVREAIDERLTEKGRGTFSSIHEILGIVTEENLELQMAVHGGDVSDVASELVDVAVGAILGLACIQAGTIDW